MNTTAITPGLASAPRAAVLPEQVWRWAIAGGVAIGIVYALSPLTVIVGVLLVPIVQWALRDLPPRERRWTLALILAAVALRVLVIAAFFATANRNAGSFRAFFGDEEFFLVRGLRLYIMWMGQGISTESFIYAYDKTGYTSYQYVLVFLQILFGEAPYGVHVFNMAVFLAGLVLLFRLVRRSYGDGAAFVGLAYLLFLPSLFTWSVSALKESLYLLLTSVVLISAVTAVRGESLAMKLAGVAGMVGGGWWLETLRVGGRAIAVGGALVGLVARGISLRRWLVAIALVVVVTVPLALWSRGFPAPLHKRIQQAARYHRGHVFTPGHTYKLLDQQFYNFMVMPIVEPQLTTKEEARYVVRAILHFVIEPLPWKAESKAELLYVPEQAVWYVVVLLVPVGLVAGFRRDPLLTCVLAGYTVVSAGIIALNSGNIGTLVRHRALVAPYLGWISALGFVSLLAAGRRRLLERSKTV
jgi:hypothetical protein